MSSSQHLDFLSRCHRHSISQYHNIRNNSISQFQEYRLRYHASVEDDTKRVQSALCTRMRIVLYAIRLGPKTSVYEMNVNVVSTVTGCDVTLLCNYITRVQQARLLASRGCVRFARRPLVALRKFSKIYACSHVSIVRLVQSIILISRDFHCHSSPLYHLPGETRLAQLSTHAKQ